MFTTNKTDTTKKSQVFLFIHFFLVCQQDKGQQYVVALCYATSL